MRRKRPAGAFPRTVWDSVSDALRPRSAPEQTSGHSG